MRTLAIDLETYCDLPIGGPNGVGSFRYIHDPSFAILLIGYSLDGAPTLVVDVAQGESAPPEFWAALTDPDIRKTAWNVSFERIALQKVTGKFFFPEQWEDTMILSASCGLPLKLDTCCKAMHIPEDQAKMKEGADLIKFFCSPVRATKANGGRTRNLPVHDPQKWETFKTYNQRDVDTESFVRTRLQEYRPDAVEHRFWCLDATINEAGIRYDKTLAVNAIRMDEQLKKPLLQEAKEIMGGNPNSDAQVKAFLQQREGIQVPSLNKDVLVDLLPQLKRPETQRLMELRFQYRKSSIRKYDKMIRCADEDHIKGCFQFFGGHTGRFAGRLVQLQNIPQNHLPDLEDAREIVREGDLDALTTLYDSPSHVLSELLRTTLIPEKGHKFIVCDFSAIEARVTAWFAQEEWRLEIFRKGGDIYCASASQMFKVPVERNGVNGHLRAKGKVAELALGYGGGVGALQRMDSSHALAEEEMQETVSLWRSSSPRIAGLWKTLETAARDSILQRVTTQDPTFGTQFFFDRGILWMTLPSGRRMAYFGARVSASDQERNRGRKVLSYMGMGQEKKNWQRIETWGGRMTENLVQATARDILREKMLALSEAGFDIRAHVHDEVIITEPKDGRNLEDVKKIFAQPVSWAPDLPLSGDGFETMFYRKD